MAKGEETRDMIVKRAAAVFNVRGFAGTSMDDLMRETGLKKGGLYNHFKSKEEIALAAFDYAVSLSSQRIEEKIRYVRHAADRLIGIGHVYRSLVEYPTLPGGCPIFKTAVTADDTMPILRDRARQAMTDLCDVIERVVNKGIERGEIKPEADGQALAMNIVSLLEGALVMSRLYNDLTPMIHANDYVEWYVNTYVRA